MVWQRQAVRHGRAFIDHIVPAILKPARTLWNEVIGFIFLCLGVSFGFYAGKYVYQQDLGRAFVAGCCTLLMVWYGVSSFRRARRISRS